MKLISIFALLLFSLPAWALNWSFQRINVTGEKEIVLEVTSALQNIYRTDSGERLINFLSDKKINFKIIETDRFYYKSGEERLLYINQMAAPEELNHFLFHTLKSVLHEFLMTDDERISFENFLEDLMLETEVEGVWTQYSFVRVRGSGNKRQRLISFLEIINANPVGKKLFKDIESCNKNLLIYDDKSSLSGGGYTGAVRTSTNVFRPGYGEDAYIRFRFDQPDDGAHLVGASRGQIKFLYIDNLYHELVHAKHTMCGTMSKNNAEAQAIEEENEFRKSRQETSDWPARDHRQYEDGVQVWFGLFI